MIEALADTYGAPLRQRPSRHLRAERGRHRSATRAAASGRAASSARRRGARSSSSRNATEAINLVASRWGRANLRAGRPHPRRPRWSTTRTSCRGSSWPRETGARARVRRHHRRRSPRPRRPARAAGDRRPKLVAIAHVATRSARSTRSPTSPASPTRPARWSSLDAAQSVPHLPVDVTELGVDFLAFSGHKMLGPSGIGALWARRELLDAMPPFLTGGSDDQPGDPAGHRVRPRRRGSSRPAPRRSRRRSALGAAIDYLEALGMDAVRAHERSLFVDALGARSARSRASGASAPTTRMRTAA